LGLWICEAFFGFPEIDDISRLSATLVQPPSVWLAEVPAPTVSNMKDHDSVSVDGKQDSIHMGLMAVE